MAADKGKEREQILRESWDKLKEKKGTAAALKDIEEFKSRLQSAMKNIDKQDPTRLEKMEKYAQDIKTANLALKALSNNSEEIRRSRSSGEAPPKPERLPPKNWEAVTASKPSEKTYKDETLDQDLPKKPSLKAIAQTVRLAVGSAASQAVGAVEDTVRNAKSKAQAKQAMKNFKIDAPIDRSSFDSEDYDSQSSRSRSSSSSSPTTPRFTRGK